jgi:molecular chaperone Hsp33
MSDSLKRWLLAGSRVRGSIVSMDASWKQIVVRHSVNDAEHQSGPVLSALGEMSAAGLLLAASIKFDGFLTLQIQGDGPIALMVVDCEPDGAFRATFRNRENSIVPADANLHSLVNQRGKGRFVVTLAPRDKHQQPYQGIVAFEGETVAQLLEAYMERSEQLETRLWLAASGDRAVGLLLQQMPSEGGNTQTDSSADAKKPISADELSWEHMVQLADTITKDELLNTDSETVMRRLFWQEDLLGIDERVCQFRCQCNRHKVASMLQMLGKAEVDSIILEQGEIAVNCEYCNTAYKFDAVDAATLFASDGSAVNLSELESQPPVPLQ